VEAPTRRQGDPHPSHSGRLNNLKPKERALGVGVGGAQYRKIYWEGQGVEGGEAPGAKPPRGEQKLGNQVSLTRLLASEEHHRLQGVAGLGEVAEPLEGLPLHMDHGDTYSSEGS